MIVATRDDIVRLSGALVKNQWLTIKAAANLLLREHPEGIIIDCGGLTHVSEEGTKTFLEAMRDIKAAGARILVANLPDEVMQVIRSVPGVRSQLPIASSVEEARASLRLGGVPVEAERATPEGGILIPLLEKLDVEYALLVAARIHRDLHLPVTLACPLVVARNLPIGAPLPEEETAANKALEQAALAARKLNMPVSRHVERVRDAEEGLLQMIRHFKVSHVIVSAYADRLRDESFMKLMDLLFQRAPCNVLIGRRAPDAEHPSEPVSSPANPWAKPEDVY
jgi:anti-anti-sigma regulatory factor